ncbi:alpha/beta-hydrolase [Rickenella mellea]|uniref:Alpha/beta-hydrolase n=1 Tax=Rickenella mellea TaxID=50990 RepID=A0A4Y7QMS1_9AGAM|nr:alpha/beta-hydrolase [Rickenella mellea]
MPSTLKYYRPHHLLNSSASVTANIRHSPPFLENLARTTLPTASVTRLQPAHIPVSIDTLSLYAAPILLNHSPPTRSSLDSLRILRDRGMSMHTSAPQNVAPTPPPSRWWWENKRTVDDLLDESDRADTVESEDAHIRSKYRSPKNPVVFCHGLLGFDSVTIGPAIAPVSVSHWRGIKEVLEANGTEVLVTRVPATSSPIERAKVLEAKISETYPGRAGGLDCRYLTTHLTERSFSVLSITTIATPHRGSSFADYFLTTVGKERMPYMLQLLDLLPNGGGDGKAFESLTLESMRRFNEDTPDVAGVKYFSWGAVFEPGLLDTFRWPHSVILEKEGPNDGLVSVASSKWGTYLGTVEDVNHLDLIGWMNTARFKWAEFTGREIKFKPATFYLGVADHLARVVEGEGKDVGEGDAGDGPEGTRAGAGVETVERVGDR